MQEIEAVLSVFHDGQFFVAVAEVREEGGCRAARHVFGAEPSPRQVYEFVLREYAALRFGKAVFGGSALAPTRAALNAVSARPRRPGSRRSPRWPRSARRERWRRGITARNGGGSGKRRGLRCRCASERKSTAGIRRAQRMNPVCRAYTVA